MTVLQTKTGISFVGIMVLTTIDILISSKWVMVVMNNNKWVFLAGIVVKSN